MSDKFVHNPKLFLLLKTLNKRELKQFDDWLSSRFHNKSEKVLKLYKGLQAIYRKLDKPIDKNILLRYINTENNSKNKEFSAKDALILRQTMSALTGQIQEFLCWQKFKENNVGANCYLVDILMERQQYKLASSILEKSKKELLSAPDKNISFYENIFQVTERIFHIDIILNNRNSDCKIQEELIERLWDTHLIRMLKYYCAAKNAEKIRKINYDYPLIEPLRQYIENKPDEDFSLIKMYYSLMNLIEKEKSEHFYSLKKVLFNHNEKFDVFIVRQFIAYLSNYCGRLILLGKNKFIVERQELNELGLRLNCWTTGIYFSAHQFINIVTNALQLQKIDWTEGFMSQYQEKLNPDSKEYTLSYCRALLHFQNGAFDESHDQLLKITSPEDFIYHLRFKVLLIKIYYEQQALAIGIVKTDPIDYELDSIRHYVMSTRNKKMSEYLRTSYNNFVNLLKRIVNRKKRTLRNEKVRGSTDKFMEELLTESPFIQRQWLKEKVEQLQEEDYTLG